MARARGSSRRGAAGSASGASRPWRTERARSTPRTSCSSCAAPSEILLELTDRRGQEVAHAHGCADGFERGMRDWPTRLVVAHGVYLVHGAALVRHGYMPKAVLAGRVGGWPVGPMLPASTVWLRP